MGEGSCLRGDDAGCTLHLGALLDGPEGPHERLVTLSSGACPEDISGGKTDPEYCADSHGQTSGYGCGQDPGRLWCASMTDALMALHPA